MTIPAIHPGEHLAEELRTINMSAASLARQLEVPASRITEILRGLFKTPFLLGFDVGVLTAPLQVSPKNPERKVSDEHAVSISDRYNRRAMAAAVSLLAVASLASGGAGSSSSYATFGYQWYPLSG